MGARLRLLLTWAGVLMLGAPLAFPTLSDAQKLPWPNVGEDPIVTPVVGPSWLTHLGIALSNTNLGKGPRRYGPAADQSRQDLQESLGVRRTIQITGADLYRFNCQACHRAEGTGAPPEIHSLLGPLQGAPLASVGKQLHRQGGRSTEKIARADANRARASVLARMHQGGRRMPPRDYLKDDDMRVLLAYLTQLAATPNASRQSTRVITSARLGELVVKGTCHICHDAVGPSPSGPALLAGAIPSLDSVLRTKRIAEFVHKARNGEVVSANDPVLRHRGRMPVFYYLRDEEAAAAYVYLATYPPRAR
jgi:mono/diheme cytochrome c family protein